MRTTITIRSPPPTPTHSPMMRPFQFFGGIDGLREDGSFRVEYGGDDTDGIGEERGSDDDDVKTVVPGSCDVCGSARDSTQLGLYEGLKAPSMSHTILSVPTKVYPVSQA